LNTDFGIESERQDCKIGAVFVQGVPVEGGRVNEELKVRECG
jgi:hypothetical protein